MIDAGLSSTNGGPTVCDQLNVLLSLLKGIGNRNWCGNDDAGQAAHRDSKLDIDFWTANQRSIPYEALLFVSGTFPFFVRAQASLWMLVVGATPRWVSQVDLINLESMVRM